MRYTSLIAAVGLAASGLAIAHPAQAVVSTDGAVVDPHCQLIITPRLVIDAQTRKFPARVGADCAASAPRLATWHSYHSNGTLVVEVQFENSTVSTFSLGDNSTFYPLGQITWRQSGARASDGVTPMTQNEPIGYVKVGARAAIGAKPVQGAPSVVDLIGRATRYASSTHSYIPWVNKVGALQVYLGGGKWKSLRTVGTNSQGYVSLRVAKGNTYRWYFPATAVIWDGTSVPLRP